MADAIDLSTIGVKVGWAAETTAGTMPTTATRLYGLKSIPALSSAPESIETTTLDALEFKTYIAGLKDLGGALEITANLTQQLKDAWAAVMTAYDTALAAGKALWLFVVIPGLDEAFGFTFQPTAMSPGEIAVNSVLETPLSVTPLNEPAWVTAPTLSDAAPTP
jgi:hypothetical protein